MSSTPRSRAQPRTWGYLYKLTRAQLKHGKKRCSLSRHRQVQLPHGGGCVHGPPRWLFEAVQALSAGMVESSACSSLRVCNKCALPVCCMLVFCMYAALLCCLCFSPDPYPHSGAGVDWRQKLENQRGAVLATVLLPQPKIF